MHRPLVNMIFTSLRHNAKVLPAVGKAVGRLEGGVVGLIVGPVGIVLS